MVRTADDMEQMLNESLARLQTDHVDFYLLHMLNLERWEQLKSFGILEFFDKIIADGRVRHVGFSSHDVNSLALLEDYDRFKLVLKQYNYLDRNLQGAEDVIANAPTGGYGVAVMEPLRGGMLGDKLPKPWRTTLDQVDVEGTPATKALLWVLSNPGVSVTLSGMGKLEYVVENVATAERLDSFQMTQELAEQYDRTTADLKRRQVVRCTGCGYCKPYCPKGIPIPYNLELLNFLAIELGIEKRSDLLRVNSVSTPTLGQHFSVIRNFWDLGEGERASACVSCRRCEDHCPQYIRIADELAMFAYLMRSDELPGRGEPSIPVTWKDLILRSRWRNKWLPDGSRRLGLANQTWQIAKKIRRKLRK
jgi:predicted aldo/keto reductase-like oxidoreductase